MGLNRQLANLPDAITTDTSNNVGIGGSPSGSYKLDVTGTGRFTGTITSSVGNNAALFYSNSATTGYQYIDIINTSGRTQLIQESSVAGTTVTNSTAYASMFGSAYAKDVILFTNGAKRLLIDGTTGAATFTQIGGSFSITTDGQFISKQNLDVATAGGRFTGQSLRGTMGIIQIEQATTGADGGKITFDVSPSGSTTPARALTLASTGAATLGTTASTTYGTLNVIQQSVSSPSFVRGIELVHPNGTGSTGGYMGISMTGVGQGTIQVGTDAAVGNLLLQSQGGNVLIGSISAISSRQELRIGGNAAGSRISLGLNGTNYSALVTDSGGNVYISNEYNDSAIKLLMINYNNGVYLSQSATSWTANSDERLKDINGTIEKALDKLKTLRAVNFSWKSDESKKEVLGLIAQDVEKVFPQVIDKNKLVNQKTDIKDETEYLGIRYVELVPVLIAAIQEMNQTITSLQDRLDKLENK